MGGSWSKRLRHGGIVGSPFSPHFVLTARRASALLGRAGVRHPRGWPSAAWASAHSQALQSEYRLFELFLFLLQFFENFGYIEHGNPPRPRSKKQKVRPKS